MNYEDCITDEEVNAVYHGNIAHVNRRDGNRYDCPTCKAKGALSAYQKQQGYQCDRCADAAEGTGF